MLKNIGNGKGFDMQVDPKRNLIRYAMRGMWDVSDYDAFMESYKEALKHVKKPWGAIVDVRDQKPSLKVKPEKMNEINLFAINNGMTCGAVVVSSAILKMTIDRTTTANGMSTKMCESEVEADSFLKANGF